MMSLPRFLLFSLCSLAASASLYAAEIEVTTSAEPPAEGALVHCEPSPRGNLRWFRISPVDKTGRRDVGQTFVTSGAATLSRLALRIAPIDEAVGEGALSARFTLQIFELEGSQEWKNATLVASQKGHLPYQFAPGEYLVFDLEATPLKAETHYAFLLTFDTPAKDRHLNISTAATHAYPEGTAFFTHLPADGEAYETTPVRGNLAFSLVVKE